MLVHRNATRPVWLISGAALAAAAFWGWPLITTPEFEYHFYGLFWYSMLGLGALFWMFPSEQRLQQRHLSRRSMWLGLLPVYTRELDLAHFDRIELEQDPNVIGKDSIWVTFQGAEGVSFVFAHFRATAQGLRAAQAVAEGLARESALPFAQPPADNG